MSRNFPDGQVHHVAFAMQKDTRKPLSPSMTTKRRNHGRSKKGRGRTTPTHCFNCHRFTPKDKAVKRFVVRNMLDAASGRDVAENSPDVYATGFPLPKLFMKQRYCVACAIHSRVVRARAVKDRKKRVTAKTARRR